MTPILFYNIILTKYTLENLKENNSMKGSKFATDDNINYNVVHVN